MHRHPNLFQRPHQLFHAVCQMVGCCSQRHQGRADDQKRQADCHKNRDPQPLLCDSQLPELHQWFSRCQKQIEYHRQKQQKYNGFHPFDHIFERDPGQLDHHPQEQGCHQISGKPVAYKQRNNIQYSPHQFHPWIQSVNHRFCLIILSQCNIS